MNTNTHSNRPTHRQVVGLIDRMLQQTKNDEKSSLCPSVCMCVTLYKKDFYLQSVCTTHAADKEKEMAVESGGLSRQCHSRNGGSGAIEWYTEVSICGPWLQSMIGFRVWVRMMGTEGCNSCGCILRFKVHNDEAVIAHRWCKYNDDDTI
jgi:hypothetical protein